VKLVVAIALLDMYLFKKGVLAVGAQVLRNCLDVYGGYSFFEESPLKCLSEICDLLQLVSFQFPPAFQVFVQMPSETSVD
jgi:hypothetical protein